MGIVGEPNVVITWGLALKQWQNSIRLLKSACLRCWMRWIWHGYTAVYVTFSHARNIETDGHSSCSSEWTSLCHVSNAFFLFLHVSFYLAFSTAVYTRKGFISSRVLVDTSEHTSLIESSSRLSLSLFFSSSSGVTVAKPAHKTHIGVFVITSLRCLLSDVLPALLWSHEHIHAPAAIRHASATSTSVTAGSWTRVCMILLTPNYLRN